MKKFVFALILSSITFTGCADLLNPNGSPYNNSPYNSPYSGGYGGGYDNRRDIDRSRREREELERERERASEERRRLERERERAERNNGSNQGWVDSLPSQSRPVDRCPSGFSPSEQKCSSQERRNGCRDIRTPGGLGCVSR